LISKSARIIHLAEGEALRQFLRREEKRREEKRREGTRGGRFLAF